MGEMVLFDYSISFFLSKNRWDIMTVMKAGLIGKKIGMTQIFWRDGSVVPVTLIEAGPCTVIQKKDKETDGYSAVQLGFGRIKGKNVTKPLKGHMEKADKGYFRALREFRTDSVGEYEVGQELKVDLFKVGDYVDIVGTTKGKGFAGVIKRHGFHGGRATHGSMFHRAPGSIGASAYPARVFKGQKMPGQMGSRRKTTQRLEVVGVSPQNNLMMIKGAVPGSKNGVVLINDSIKV